MKFPPARLVLLALGCAALALPSRAADAGSKSIFNGKDLSGWEGNMKLWSVRDGVITGQTKSDQDLAAGNTFLVLKGIEPANFELRLSFRLTGQNEKKSGNSGVQYRSRLMDPTAFVVGGYQADIDSDGKYAGMLYEERGRGILMAPGEKIRVTAATGTDPKKKATVEKLGVATTAAELAAIYRKGEWNELRIVADGNHVQHYLNGKMTADVVDADAALAPKSGVIALQLHKGPPMTIEFKDLQLKVLP